MTTRNMEPEQTFTFSCREETLIGILHPGTNASDKLCRHGVLVVVGGPQYRVGSHRQFVLLARGLAALGIPVMRFDYRGMGDSSGCLRDFSDVGDDIRVAIDAFQQKLPGVDEFVIWGLCDAASAAAFYGSRDERVKGLVLLNPWIRTQSGEARTVLRHYYLQRILSGDFWRKLFSGRLKLGRSLADLREVRRRANASDDESSQSGSDLPAVMLSGLEQFQGRVLLILSGNDLVAQEFQDHAREDRGWHAWLHSSGVCRRDLPVADHTFSRRSWRDQVTAWTHEWLDAW